MKKCVNYLVILCLLLLFNGCDRRQSKSSMLKLTFLTEVNSLDPRFGYELPANHAVKMLFEGLLRMDLNGKIVPALAEDVSISPDGLTYTFKLRESVWNNGLPVTASDFAYAWSCIIDPSKPTQGKSDFFPIKNAEKIIAGQCPLEEVGIYVKDPRTLVVELEHPAAYFLELVTTSVYAPVCEKVDKVNPKWAYKASTFVSNGPFKLTKWKKNDEMLLEKNSHYWDAAAVRLEGIEIAIVDDVMTQMNLFEKKQIDWFGKPLTKLPLDAVPALQQSGNLHYFPEQAVYWYFLNTEKFPFNVPKVRLALALAIKRQDIVAHVLKENEESATRIVRDNSICDYFQDGDLATARRLLDEALKELGLTLETFPEIPLSYCGIETNRRVAAVVKEQWEQGLKIKVRLDPQEWTTYYDNLTSGNYLVGGLSWHSRTTDPIYNLQIFKLKEDRLNISNWENDRFKALLTAAQSEINPDKRKALLISAERLLMQEMPVIPIYFLSISYAKKAELEDVFISQTNQLDFSRAYFVPR